MMDPSCCLTAAGQHLSKSYGQFEFGFKLLWLGIKLVPESLALKLVLRPCSRPVINY